MESVKEFRTKDGNTRLLIIRDENAETPRYMTDEPFHCADFNRDYSIEISEEKGEYSDSRSFITSMLGRYGKYNKILDYLVFNGRHLTDGEAKGNNALVYDPSGKRWILKGLYRPFMKKEMEWNDEEYFYEKKEYIDLYGLLDKVEDSTIDEFCKPEYWTDGIKINSYSFGYYGELSFSDYFDTESEGLCWLIKNEFLKYSGHKEEYWKKNKLREIEWLIDELIAWADNEVYGIQVEKRMEYNVVKTCLSEEKETENYNEEEWEEEDSCYGFYGELDTKHIEWMLGEFGYKLEELEEIS